MLKLLETLRKQDIRTPAPRGEEALYVQATVAEGSPEMLGCAQHARWAGLQETRLVPAALLVWRQRTAGLRMPPSSTFEFALLTMLLEHSPSAYSGHGCVLTRTCVMR